MRTPYPEQAGMVAASLMISLGDSISGMLLEFDPAGGEQARETCFQRMQDSAAAYTDAIERVLGAPAGSISLFDPHLLKEWVMP